MQAMSFLFVLPILPESGTPPDAENARLWGLFSHSQPGVRLSGQTKPFGFPYQYRQYRPSYAL